MVATAPELRCVLRCRSAKKEEQSQLGTRLVLDFENDGATRPQLPSSKSRYANHEEGVYIMLTSGMQRVELRNVLAFTDELRICQTGKGMSADMDVVIAFAESPIKR